MKLKYYHIYLFAVIVFLIVFIGVNNKYDRFYRISGMNNENRILIETYLDDASQNYVVEQNLGVNEFIKFITYDGFDIEHYEYYRIVETASTFLTLQEVVSYTNEIVDKLYAQSPWNVLDNLNILVDNRLLKDYLSNEGFDFKHISIYKKLKPFYASDDYSYLNLVEENLENLHKLGYTTLEECSRVLVELFNYYSPVQVERLIQASMLVSKKVFVENPTAYDTLLKDSVSVDSYVPNDLVLLEELPRKTYFLYLKEEAYLGLFEMCQAYEVSESYLSYYVASAYESYEAIESQDVTLAGKKETQLGYTVSFQVMGLAMGDFEGTSFDTWLKQHAYEYGFVLRYPSDKEEITHHSYEPYTYRYVGKEMAKEMKDKNYTTIEEYVDAKK